MRAFNRWLNRPKCSQRQSVAKNRTSERGTTAAEYALLVSLIVTVSIGAVEVLTNTSSDSLNSTGSDIGRARLENEDILDELPPEPSWLEAPPTFATTLPPTTSVPATSLLDPTPLPAVPTVPAVPVAPAVPEAAEAAP